MRLSGCDHIRIHFGKRPRHAFGSLRANSYSHRVRFGSLLTTSPHCLRACTLQAQAVPAGACCCCTTRSRARAARAAGARDAAGVRGGTFRLRFLVVGSSNLLVCCWLCLCVPVGTTPSSSCASLFVSLSLRRPRLGSRAVCNRQRLGDRRNRVETDPELKGR